MLAEALPPVPGPLLDAGRSWDRRSGEADLDDNISQKRCVHHVDPPPLFFAKGRLGAQAATFSRPLIRIEVAAWTAYRPDVVVVRSTPRGFTLNGSRLAILVEGPSGMRRWSGAPICPGSRVELTWTPARAEFVAVVARYAGESDGRLRALLVFPEDNRAPAKIDGGRDVPLGEGLRFGDQSVQLSVFASEQEFPIIPLLAGMLLPAGPSFAGRTLRVDLPVAAAGDAGACP